MGHGKKENTIEALKCQNLECVIDADMQRKLAPPELTLDQLLNEEDVLESAADDAQVVVVDQHWGWWCVYTFMYFGHIISASQV